MSAAAAGAPGAVFSQQDAGNVISTGHENRDRAMVDDFCGNGTRTADSNGPRPGYQDDQVGLEFGDLIKESCRGPATYDLRLDRQVGRGDSAGDLDDDAFRFGRHRILCLLDHVAGHNHPGHVEYGAVPG